jgi:hypothetical protein
MMSDFKNFECSRQILAKPVIMKPRKNQFCGRRVVPRGKAGGRTDGHVKVNFRFWNLCGGGGGELKMEIFFTKKRNGAGGFNILRRQNRMPKE